MGGHTAPPVAQQLARVGPEVTPLVEDDLEGAAEEQDGKRDDDREFVDLPRGPAPFGAAKRQPEVDTEKAQRVRQAVVVETKRPDLDQDRIEVMNEVGHRGELTIAARIVYALVMSLAVRLLSCVAPVLLLLACGGGPAPEEQIRERIGEGVEAAENRDLGALRRFIADDYADPQGRDKRAIEGMLALYLRQSESLHLFPVIRSVTLASESRAEATVLLGMAGRPIHNEAELRSLQADLYQIDLVLVRESKEWKVVEAFWEQVSVS